MVWQLARDDLGALGCGCSLLGSGGGGSPRVLELALRRTLAERVDVHEVADLDPAMPCLAAGFVGSTILLTERLPDPEPFAVPIAALERWTGGRIPAACTIEVGGLNGLSALHLAGDLHLVDADLMGRAMPSIDQLSVIVDRVPGLVAACWTGGDGVVLVEGARGPDLERLVRTAVQTAGGYSVLVVAGLTVGDLAEHAVLGSWRRALELGRSYVAARTDGTAALAAAIGARLLGRGLVAASSTGPDGRLMGFDVRSVGGPVLRLVARDEILVALVDGAVEAATPTIVVALDDLTHEVLEAHELAVGRHVAVLSLPGPTWWDTPARRGHVAPQRYGIEGLDGAA
ncbi:MAG: DUF917 domain-containing protein [Actinobacteria bacterium]|nr:DUF917 domain-containing protein [Actinomycetota bacterium]MCG2802704.1 DUF917 domain-containing protein [Cellulomonas sp.]